MKTLLALLLLQVMVVPQTVTTTDLPLVPPFTVRQGQALAIPLTPGACLESIIIREKQYRCRPDNTIIIGIEMNARPSTYPITTSNGVLVASLEVTDTRWPEVRRPAGRAGAVAPAGRLERDRVAKNIAFQTHTRMWQSHHLQFPLQSPIDSEFRITDGFGLKRFYGKSKTPLIHNGADLAAPESGAWARRPPSAQSMAPGVVVLAQPLWLEGNAVIVYHGDAVYTSYSHLKNITVKQGDLVGAGRTLGSIGSSGHASGAHLHLTLNINGAVVDPLPARITLR